MDIVERMQIALDGGLDSWPTASIAYEYNLAIREINALRAKVKSLEAASGQPKSIDAKPVAAA